MEYVGVAAVFGERANSVAISSNKSMIGHTLTAAGAIEAVFSMLTIGTGTIPPTINYQTPDPACDLDYTPNQARQRPVAVAMSNSFGFGGHNAVIIVKKYVS